MDTRSLVYQFLPSCTYTSWISLSNNPNPNTCTYMAWINYYSNSDPGRAGIASQTRYTTVWNANSSTKYASFAFDRYRTEISPINYFQKKYTYAEIEISSMSKVCWLLRSSWKHELKLSHYSSDTKGDALRTNVKIIKWNESFSRQRLSQSCLFKSLKIKKKQKKTEHNKTINFSP